MQIYPSILETDVDGLNGALQHFRGYFKKIQIDITDGFLVPNLTIQPSDISQILTEEPELLKNYEIEFHLMVEDFSRYLASLEKLDLGIVDILIHVASKNFTNNFEDFSNLLGEKNIQLGIVLNPEDQVGSWKKYIWKVDKIQLMTVHPGKQGNPFLPHVLTKIDELRELGYRGEILLDGGINDKTLGLIHLRKSLPDAVCPGSWLKGMDVDQLSEILYNIPK